jgi:hypothetical protein
MTIPKTTNWALILFCFSTTVLSANEFRLGSLDCEQIWKQGGQSAKAKCPTGMSLLSGGCKVTTLDGAEDLLDSYPDIVTRTWHCLTSHEIRKVMATAICCR